MYLKSIKLVGFKSFVDATVIPVKSHMSAIVGPNGCGKSNVIDAIRWVIGETSAKQLRGQSMSDVIFNGTTARKPVGKAAVELVFDNSEGRIGGEYAQYAEISVRREVERDGQSAYFLNGTHCRRRDILDVFLGTGLGPRSYAIIEQGMVSRLIEAKPEDLRVFVEEASGISKYKERRRETENRIKRTNENLDRLNDLREELTKQQRHLKRQANAAERYQEYKAEEQLLHAQVKALQWQAFNEQCRSHDESINTFTLEHEEQVANLRGVETEIEKGRLWQSELTEKQNEVQKRYYGLGAEVARIEQQIKHTQEQTSRWQAELNEAESLHQEISDNSAEQQEQISELTYEIEQLTPKTDNVTEVVRLAEANLQEAEEAMQQWQFNWDQWQSQSAQTNQQAEVSKTKVENYRHQLSRLVQRITDLQSRVAMHDIQGLVAEAAPLAERVDLLTAQIDTITEKLESTRANINQQRQSNSDLNQNLKTERKALQSIEARHAALDALQQSALGVNDDHTKAWLSERELQSRPRLGKELRVNAGWELAVETVLSGYFDAVCVDDVDQFIDHVTGINQGRLTLVDGGRHDHHTNTSDAKTLLSQVQTDWPVTNWLQNIYIADDLAAAKALRADLADTASVITRDGIWLGRNWVRIAKPSDGENGILSREQELETLAEELANLRRKIAGFESDLQNGEQRLAQLEMDRDQQHSEYQNLTKQLTEARSAYTAHQSRLDELQQQQQRLQSELQDCQQQQAQIEDELMQLQTQQQQAEQSLAGLSDQKEALLAERDQRRQQLDQARAHAQAEKQRADELSIRITSSENQLNVLKRTVSHAERQLNQLAERREALSANLTETDGPLEQLNRQLQAQLEQRAVIEKELHTVENEFASHSQELKQLESRRNELTALTAELQTKIQELRMERQTVTVRQTTIKEQLEESGLQLETVLQELPAEAAISEWEANADKITQKITRLGPINLAAIDEYKSVTERKEYLDKQHDDLAEALSVLDSAIRKIDRETRSKFKDTFERINENFQKIFPRVFGGGKAYLELEEEDLLTAGVTVRAQPPGKRNVTIHMLSGGEKALTAISLVFAMFQINPAPFCILDEVDAPLDDLNVSRYCALVKEMAKETQFIVISHNKVTIEMADHLMGVTMQEAGVSRLVAVDMEEAIAMAEA